MADLFPLVLSIVTLTILLLQCVVIRSRLAPITSALTRHPYILPYYYHSIIVDLTSKNAFIARPVVEIPLLGTLTIVWLGKTCHFLFSIHGPRSYRVHAIPTTHTQRSILSRRRDMLASRTVRSFQMVRSEMGKKPLSDHSTCFPLVFALFR